MQVEELYTLLRNLAKGNNYQTVYSLSKECPIWVFENRSDFSDIQLTFLSFLSFYYSIQMDIGMGEITERVLENEIYEEAYVYYRNQERKNKLTKQKPDTTKQYVGPNKIQEKSEFKWIFKSPKRKSK